MKTRKLKSRKAQTALEYIAASFVFATVGICAFLLTTQGSVLSTIGTSGNYGVDQTLQGVVLGGAGDLPQSEWPSSWEGPQEGLNGASLSDARDASDKLTSIWNDDPNAVSTWDDEQERNFVGQAGLYWEQVKGEQAGVDLPKIEEVTRTAEGMQREFDNLTKNYTRRHRAGYNQEDLDYINHGLDEDWFIPSEGGLDYGDQDK